MNMWNFSSGKSKSLSIIIAKVFSLSFMCLNLDWWFIAGEKNVFQLFWFWSFGGNFFGIQLERIFFFFPCPHWIASEFSALLYKGVFKMLKMGWLFRVYTLLLSEEEGKVPFLMPLKFSWSQCFLQCSCKHGALLCNH